MAGLYRQKVLALREALAHEDARPQAVEALRGLLDAILLKPEEGAGNSESPSREPGGTFGAA